jgi:hypothetical protein
MRWRELASTSQKGGIGNATSNELAVAFAAEIADMAYGHR